MDGPNSAPVPVFQVSEADLNRIAEALGRKTNKSESGTSGVDTGSAPSTKTQVDTQALMNLLNTVDNLNQASTLGAQDAAQKSAQESAKEDKHGSAKSGSSSIS